MNIYTTIGEGLPVEVIFDHSPAEEAKLYGENVHPGSRASIDITKITVATGELCIYDALNQKTLDAIEAECFEGEQVRNAHDSRTPVRQVS